jgi:hypothetical protein
VQRFNERFATLPEGVPGCTRNVEAGSARPLEVGVFSLRKMLTVDD